MSLPKSYLTSTKNLSSILSSIQSAQAPEKFTTRFLEALGYPSSNDRLIIGVFKSLGFLEPDGRPTERYYRFLDQTQSETVLAEAVKDAYSDLFQIKKDAQNFSKGELVNKIKTLSQGSLSESVLDKVAATFLALAGKSDFEALDKKKLTGSSNETVRPSANNVFSDLSHQAHTEKENGEKEITGFSPKPSLGGLHYNIQIILPSTRDPAVYDAIFRSIKEHLLE